MRDQKDVQEENPINESRIAHPKGDKDSALSKS